MDIKPNSSIQRLRPTPRWSDATLFNGIAHFVEVAADTEQDLISQTAQILAQTEATLSDIGSDKSQLLSATIYLTDPKMPSLLTHSGKHGCQQVVPPHALAW